MKQMYKCEFCSRISKSKLDIKKHEIECSGNPLIKNINKIKQKSYVAIDEIRKNAISIEDLIQKIEKYLLTLGIKLAFKSYPCNFSKNISNSHTSPKGYDRNWGGNDDKPNGYPGWSGYWEGKIEIIDSSILGKKHLSFSELVNEFNLHFFQTTSGSGGSDFRYSGMLWLYDFPVMHQEFEDSGEAFSVLDNEYFTKLIAYQKEYNDKRQRFIDDDKDIIYIKDHEKELKKLSLELQTIRSQKSKALKNDFNQKYGKDLPLPPRAFISDSTFVMNVHAAISFNAETIHPDIEPLFQRVEDLTQEILKYIDKKPEEFI